MKNSIKNILLIVFATMITSIWMYLVEDAATGVYVLLFGWFSIYILKEVNK